MYKFNQNDIFYNTVKTYPSHTIMMYNNNLYINNQINEYNKNRKAQDSQIENMIQHNLKETLINKMQTQ